MEAILSLLDEPLLTVKDSADITFCNLQVEAACGSGILVEDCTGVTIDNCHIRNIGNHGVILLRGKNNQVLNSTLHDCGDCGVEAVGGDRLTLESADFRICNNHMYRGKGMLIYRIKTIEPKKYKISYRKTENCIAKN